jgi:hypothetical protein
VIAGLDPERLDDLRGLLALVAPEAFVAAALDGGATGYEQDDE